MKQLGVFAKYWAPGAVKTRLAAAIGESAAASFHEASVRTLLSRLCRTAERRVLGFAPANREQDFTEAAGISWQLQPQVDGNLGKRMADYFRTAFETGATRVVLIGSDSPTLPVGYVEKAFEDLEVNNVTVGPSSDGGYYLIGASRPVPRIFEGIDWGSEKVLQQTGALLREHDVSWTLLPHWYDVDQLEDLQRLQTELEEELAGDSEFDRLRAVVEATLAG